MQLVSMLPVIDQCGLTNCDIISSYVRFRVSNKKIIANIAFNELIMPKIVKQTGNPRYSWPNGNNVVTKNWTLHMIDTAIAMQTWRILWKKNKIVRCSCDDREQIIQKLSMDLPSLDIALMKWYMESVQFHSIQKILSSPYTSLVANYFSPQMLNKD